MTENFKQQERVTEEQKVQANGLKQQQYLLAPPISMTDTAIQYVKSGLSVVPIGNDKQPTVKWKPFQSKCASTSAMPIWPSSKILLNSLSLPVMGSLLVTPGFFMDIWMKVCGDVGEKGTTGLTLGRSQFLQLGIIVRHQ